MYLKYCTIQKTPLVYNQECFEEKLFRKLNRKKTYTHKFKEYGFAKLCYLIFLSFLFHSVQKNLKKFTLLILISF